MVGAGERRDAMMWGSTDADHTGFVAVVAWHSRGSGQDYSIPVAPAVERPEYQFLPAFSSPHIQQLATVDRRGEQLLKWGTSKHAAASVA